MNKRVLLLVVASFSASMIVGCGDAPNRDSTANRAIDKLKCVNAFDTEKENGQLGTILAAKYNGMNHPAVVTFLSKYEVPAGTQPLVDVSQALVTTDTSESFSTAIDTSKTLAEREAKGSPNLFTLTKNCETLTADLRGPGVELIGLTIKSMKTTKEISLTKSENGSDITVNIKKDGRTKIAINKDRHVKWKDNIRQKRITDQDFEDGNTILTIDIESKGVSAQKISFQQLSGDIDNTDKVTVSSAVYDTFTNNGTENLELLAVEEKATPIDGLDKLTADSKTPTVVDPKADRELKVIGLINLKDKANELVKNLPAAVVPSTDAPVPVLTIAPVDGATVAIPAPAADTSNAAKPASAATVAPTQSLQVPGTET